MKLIRGDARDVLAGMSGDSVDSIVTDPPYGLSAPPDVAQVLTAWLAGDRYEHGKAGFMGKDWDSFVPGPDVWRECLRVLKPGGHMLVFAGTRTQDLMGISVRLAGFELRDCMSWLYGTGFPKSMDVAKAITKTGVGDSAPWRGYGTALKPAYEPILLCRKPLEGTVANNVLAHGTGALNIGDSRVATDEKITNHARGAQSALSKGILGSSSAQKTHQTDGQLAGRFPSNVLLTHHPGCIQCGTKVIKGGRPLRVSEKRDGTDYESSVYVGRVSNGSLAPGSRSLGAVDQHVEDWDCDPGCPVRLIDEQNDTLPGGTSRFFYCAKASKSERNAGLPDGVSNIHPTVKPIRLMEYLVRLVTPPGGVVLDPFCGSGTTLVAATRLGFEGIGIDKDDDNTYLGIAAARIAAEEQSKSQETQISLWEQSAVGR